MGPPSRRRLIGCFDVSALCPRAVDNIRSSEHADVFDTDAFLVRRLLTILERLAAEPATTPSERASALTVDAGIRTNRALVEWEEAAIDQIRTW